MSLEFTGERFLPSCQGEMVYEHWHRYLFARTLARGKRVLDVASGEGYGTDLLATVAASAVGVDLSAEAVAHANARYGRDGLSYVAASCTDIPLPDESVDLLVSFETIEHIHEQEAFVAEVVRLLAPGGLFVISSPNRPEYSDKTGYRNEFHVKELDREELAVLLQPYFAHTRWLGQRAAFHSMLWPIGRNVQRAEGLTVDGQSAWPEPMYFIVVAARDADALALVDDALTLVTDRENSVYAAWTRTYRDNHALVAENERLRERIAALEKSASGASPQAPEPSPAAAPVPSDEPALVRWARRLSGHPRGGRS